MNKEQKERVKSWAIYAAKCVVGASSVFMLSELLNYKDLGWSLISVILVLSPDGKDAVSLAFTRIKANVLGAAIGLLCLLIDETTMWTLSLGLVATLGGCYLLKLQDSARTAMAATVIIMLHAVGKHIWDVALLRVVAVMAGCVLGLLITYLFHFRSNEKQKKADLKNPEA